MDFSSVAQSLSDILTKLGWICHVIVDSSIFKNNQNGNWVCRTMEYIALSYRLIEAFNQHWPKIRSLINRGAGKPKFLITIENYISETWTWIDSSIMEFIKRHILSRLSRL